VNDKCCADFQNAVDEYLIRHRSVLDVLTKYQEATARVNRAFAKAVTECGCVEVNAGRQQAPSETDFRDLKQFVSSHVSGEPCEHCKEVLAKELGHSLFYMAALCNVVGLSFHDVMRQECKNVKTLGVFHLT
jgi:hypothetical protein